MLSSQSGSESRTMAGKRSPPSPSREYMSLSTLWSGHPGTTDESCGDRVSDRACHRKDCQHITFFVTHRLSNYLAQLSVNQDYNPYLFEVNLLLQQCHPKPQLLQLSELCLCFSWLLVATLGQAMQHIRILALHLMAFLISFADFKFETLKYLKE